MAWKKLCELAEAQCWLDLRPYVDAAAFCINEHATIQRAYRMFRTLGLRHLCVVNHGNEVQGILTRADLADLANEAEELAPVHEAAGSDLRKILQRQLGEHLRHEEDKDARGHLEGRRVDVGADEAVREADARRRGRCVRCARCGGGKGAASRRWERWRRLRGW